jgi:hypothetical protein
MLSNANNDTYIVQSRCVEFAAGGGDYDVRMHKKMNVPRWRGIKGVDSMMSFRIRRRRVRNLKDFSLRFEMTIWNWKK